MKTVVHKLVGYDGSTEEIAFECKVPAKVLEHVKDVANVGAHDRSAIGSYPLDRMQARDVAGYIGCRLPNANLDYFLEAFAEPSHQKPPVKRAYA